MNKNSYALMQNRFLQEFEALCMEKGYEPTTRLQLIETVKFIQEIGYLTDPKRKDPTGPDVSVIEE